MIFDSIYLQRIRKLFYSCQFKEAIEEIRQHLTEQGQPDHVSLMNLYFSYLAIGDKLKAKESFDEALKISPDGYFELSDACILDFKKTSSLLTHEDVEKLYSALKTEDEFERQKKR